MIETSRWEERLRSKRRGKDRFFGEDPRSPIGPQEQEGFDGLRYYPVDPSYRFELPLHEHETKEEVTLEASHSQEREFVRWGEFRFSIGETECTLQAYRSDAEDERLFLPFRDATSGEETYPEGRYLDLEPEIHRTSRGNWLLDFNEAYNPWCAYSEDFVCPFAPRENWLEVPIRAGEKAYGG